MTKYQRAIKDLEETGTATMKVFGQSMKPLIESGATLTFTKQSSYEIDDIVFSKVKGRFIDAHKITKKSGDRFMIANNHGYENGWTNRIFGKVTKIEY